MAVSARAAVVVKLGGEVVGGAGDARRSRAISRALVDGGSRVVVTHGGGPQATALQKQLGLEPRMVGGRRVTDAATLDVMKMVVAGKVNVDLCARARARRRPSASVGAARCRARAQRRPPQRRLRRRARSGRLRLRRRRRSASTCALLEPLLDGGYVPVIACLGADGDGARLQHQRRHRRQPARRRARRRRARSSSPARPASCATSTIRRRASRG